MISAADSRGRGAEYCALVLRLRPCRHLSGLIQIPAPVSRSDDKATAATLAQISPAARGNVGGV